MLFWKELIIILLNRIKNLIRGLKKKVYCIYYNIVLVIIRYFGMRGFGIRL